MSPQKTITINGRLYDAVTGLPIEGARAAQPAKTLAPAQAKPVAKPAAKPATWVAAAPVAAAQSTKKSALATIPIPKPPASRVPRPTGTPRPDVMKTSAPAPKKPAAVKPSAPSTPRSQTSAPSVHSSPQRSQTLNRRAAKKPAIPAKPITRRPVVGRHIDTAKSTDVSRFAKHPNTDVAPKVIETKKPATAAKPHAAHKAAAKDKPARVHPVAERAFARVSAKKPTATKPTTAKEVKDAAITKALATPKQKPVTRAKRDAKRTKRIIIITSVVATLLLALFAVYRLFPGISVSVAAAQAGIEATYPEYTPDGYTLSQPVTYTDGEVDLTFKSNSNENYYSITQTRSSWDSSAVLDKVVTPEAGADYVTTKERGLTIYTYDSAAVWVNGGILYKIDSKAPLSGDQIRKIATSL